MADEPVVRWKQQFAGMVAVALGLAGTAWTWQAALTGGSSGIKFAGMMPAAIVLGGAMVLFPGPKEERTARGEDITGLSGLQLLTPRWWAVAVVGFAAGFGNVALLRLA